MSRDTSLNRFIKKLRGFIRQRWRLLSSAFLKPRLLSRHGDVIETMGLRIAVDSPQITARQIESLLKGGYEFSEVEMTRRFLDPSLPTIELGGSIGVLANLTNRLLDRPEDHVVVEANPLVAPVLHQNRDLNGGKFEIIEAAIAYGAPTIEFVVGPDAMTGSTKRRHRLGSRVVKVPTLNLRQIIESRGFGVINLIVDIEGAEIDLARHELDVLRDHVKTFILETHEWAFKDGSTGRMLQSLESAGFRVVHGDRDAPHVLTMVNDALAHDAPSPSPVSA